MEEGRVRARVQLTYLISRGNLSGQGNDVGFGLAFVNGIWQVTLFAGIGHVCGRKPLGL